jgi:hypothetical protein
MAVVVDCDIWRAHDECTQAKQPAPPSCAATWRLRPCTVYCSLRTLGGSPPHNGPASGRPWHYREQQYKRLGEKGRRERCGQARVSR